VHPEREKIVGMRMRKGPLPYVGMGAASEVGYAADRIRVSGSADQNGRQVTLWHSSPAGVHSDHTVKCLPADYYSS